MNSIYLDYASSTPLANEVVDEMISAMSNNIFGNPSSTDHEYGKNAYQLIEDCRKDVANLIHADQREIIWTSGATEANNLAIFGSYEFNLKNKSGNIITSMTEHKSVIEPFKSLEKKGLRVLLLSPKRNGEIDLNKLEKTINEDTLMVSLMHINNETGVLNDIESIGEICRKKNVIFHVDAAQSIGKVSIDVNNLEVDMMSLASHKIYGPKGVGALYINGKKLGRIAPILQGGGQERGIRPGTLPTHQIVGMAAAFRLAKKHMNNDLKHIKECRALFLKSIASIEDAVINTDDVSTFPGIISLCLPDLDAESIIFGMKRIALSKGSACTSDSDEPSHVLKSMGLSQEEIRGTLRISFGRYTTMNEVSIAAESLTKIVTHLKLIKGQ
tara:strand:+ start:614 stop:1771 length:1158 start_codon:yes stop_codon:yes gene_type:complete